MCSSSASQYCSTSTCCQLLVVEPKVCNFDHVDCLLERVTDVLPLLDGFCSDPNVDPSTCFLTVTPTLATIGIVVRLLQNGYMLLGVRQGV